MNITIPHEANASELAMKLGGAVHGVGGPPATIEHDNVKHPVGALSEIAGIVALPQLSTSDWTVSSEYTAPAAAPSVESDRFTDGVADMVKAIQHGKKTIGAVDDVHLDAGDAGVKADESEK